MSEENISVVSADIPANAEQQNVDSVNSSVQADTSAKPSKMFSEDQMRAISNDVRKRTEEKIRQEFEAKYGSANNANSNLGYNNDNAVAPNQVTPQNQSYANLNEEQLYQNFRQRQEREQAEYNQQQLANDFLAKIQSAGKSDKIEASGIGQIPTNHPIVAMLNSVDNLADVIDDFAENPVKVANLLAVTHLNPMNGMKEIQALSASIKRNKEALAKEKAPAPLTTLKSSGYGLVGGESSISSRRRNKMFKF